MGKVLRMIRSGRFPGFEEWVVADCVAWLVVLIVSVARCILQSVASHFAITRV
jgi:hypothetical protein